NLESWDEKVERETKETKTRLSQNEKDNKVDTSKDNINTTTNNKHEKAESTNNIYVTTLTTNETDNTTKTRNGNNSSLDKELETNPYNDLQESSSKNEGSKKTPPKQWSSLFPKLRRGQSTYSSFSPRGQIRTKNE